MSADLTPAADRPAEPWLEVTCSRRFTAWMEEQRVSLACNQTPVKDALAELTKQTGYRIDLQGGGQPALITLDLANVTFWEALDKVSAQAGLVLQQHHDAFLVFPSNGGWDGKQTIKDVNGKPFTPQSFDYTTGGTYQWGVGDPSLRPRDQTGCWAFSLLP